MYMCKVERPKIRSSMGVFVNVFGQNSLVTNYMPLERY